jgi:nucleotide-binding universal stress UspA family protein
VSESPKALDDEKVLACVDRSRFADCVADYASWAARRIGAPLEFLHILDRHPERGTGEDHSGAIGIDAQASLLSELADKDEARSREAREAGRAFLAALRERASAAGAPFVDVRQRHGEFEETLVEQVRAVQLVVLGRRGRNAEITRRDLGRNLERVVRALEKPILAVTDTFTEPRRVMIAFDGSRLARKGVELVAGSRLFAGLPVHVIVSGKVRGDTARELAWAERTLAAAGYEATAKLLPGDAETVLAGYVQEASIDLLIMGAYSHSPLRSLFLGSRTTDLLRAAAVPTLLLR